MNASTWRPRDAPPFAARSPRLLRDRQHSIAVLTAGSTKTTSCAMSAANSDNRHLVSYRSTEKSEVVFVAHGVYASEERRRRGAVQRGVEVLTACHDQQVQPCDRHVEGLGRGAADYYGRVAGAADGLDVDRAVNGAVRRARLRYADDDCNQYRECHVMRNIAAVGLGLPSCRVSPARRSPS